MHEEKPDEGELPAAAEGERLSLVGHLEGSEDAELHRPTLAR